MVLRFLSEEQRLWLEAHEHEQASSSNDFK